MTTLCSAFWCRSAPPGHHPAFRLLSQRLGQVGPSAGGPIEHSQSTALFGGLAIARDPRRRPHDSRRRTDCDPHRQRGALIAGFGFLDDVPSLKPSTKLIAQIISRFDSLLFFGYPAPLDASRWLGDAMLTVFWIVGITNAFNLLDNMDGLCAGIALIAGRCSADRAARRRRRRAAGRTLYLAILLGADRRLPRSTTFIRRRSSWATRGSLFLGVNLAALTLVAHHRAPDEPRSVLSAVAVAGPAAADSDLRHDARDGDARAVRDGAPSRADAITRRTVWSRLDCRSRGGRRRSVAAGGDAAASSRCSSAARSELAAGRRRSSFLLAMVIFAVYLARDPRLRRRRAATLLSRSTHDAARRPTSCTSAASPRSCSISV